MTEGAELLVGQQHQPGKVFSLSPSVISLFCFTAIEWHSVFVQSQFTANGNAKAPTIDNSSRLFSKDIPLLLLRIPGNTFQHLV